MGTTTITEAKNRLSALIDRVQAGESIVILERGRPVARLEPIVEQDDPTGRLARLERAGIIKMGRGKPPLDLIRTPGPKIKPGFSLVDAVIEERRTGR
jgi:prevent-host-death family protein